MKILLVELLQSNDIVLAKRKNIFEELTVTSENYN